MSTELSNNKKSKIDITFSWKLFIENYKAFLSTELFAIGATIIGVFVIIVCMISIGNNSIWLTDILFWFIPIIFITFQIFMTSQYGFAFDILSSGDMYAVFIGAFKYFKRHWWQYFLIILISSIMNMGTHHVSLFIYTSNQDWNFTIIDINQWFLLTVAVRYIWKLLFIAAFPSVTATNSIKTALHENYRILRNNIKRYILTFSYFFAIFRLPFLLFWEVLVYLYSLHILDPQTLAILFLVSAGIGTIMKLIELPLLALIVTRIYNTTNEEMIL